MVSINHAKTNTITDWTQADLDAQIALGNFPPGTLPENIVLPSDWNAALTTSMATNKLLGRGTAGTGVFEEITLGTNLSLAGTTLNAAGGSGTTNYINSTRIDQTPAAGTYGTLAGTVNGSNAVFTVSNSAYASGSLMVLLNGQEQTQGAAYDWQETSPAAGTFTFNVAPPTGSIIQAAYITQATTTGTGNSPVILSTTSGINAKTVATTNLYTVPVGLTAIITAATIRCTAATAITVGPTLGIGVAAGESDIFSSTAITALTTTAVIYNFTALGMSVSVAAGGIVKLGIDTGSTGTSQTIAVDLIGYTV